MQWGEDPIAWVLVFQHYLLRPPSSHAGLALHLRTQFKAADPQVCVAYTTHLHTSHVIAGAGCVMTLTGLE